MAGRPLTVTIMLTAALLLLLLGCSPDAKPVTSPSAEGPADTTRRDLLEPTPDDGLSPSYEPDAPNRSVVGTGHVLTGRVVSSRDGAPIPGAKLELWPEYAGLGHPDSARATVVTDKSGRYTFQCDPPEHVHMRITAAGYAGIAQNSYHPEGQATGTFDIVLRPE